MPKLEDILPELRDFAIFKGFDVSQILDFCKNAQIVSSLHRDPLFRAGDPAEFFGIVLSGAYKLSRSSPSGDDIIVHFSIRGDVIAGFIMVHPQPVYPVSAIAMGVSRFIKIPRVNYLEIWKKNSDLIFRLQNLLSARMSLLQDQKVMVRAPLSQKVATLLIALSEKNPSRTDLEISLPLTRKEIADTLGASVESVIRIMSEWSKLGIIQTNDQHIRIVKPEKVIEYLQS